MMEAISTHRIPQSILVKCHIQLVFFIQNEWMYLLNDQFGSDIMNALIRCVM
jgi:hypothetical protein